MDVAVGDQKNKLLVSRSSLLANSFAQRTEEKRTIRKQGIALAMPQMAY
jgi:hypothetical protein